MNEIFHNRLFCGIGILLADYRLPGISSGDKPLTPKWLQADLPHNCWGSCRPEPTGSQCSERTAMTIYAYLIRRGSGYNTRPGNKVSICPGAQKSLTATHKKKMNLDHRQNRFADNFFSLTKMSTSVQFSVQDSAEDVYCTVFSTVQR